MRTVQEYCYCRQDIADILETTPNCISQHVKRGHLDMGDLKSVLLFLAQYGPDHLRFEVLKAAAWLYWFSLTLSFDVLEFVG